MAIEQYLTNISIDGGAPGIYAGGYIFSAKAETGFTTSPSKCTIRIVLPNSPNITNPPTPSLLKTYSLSINGYNFFAYLLESSVEKTVGETIFNLIFCDQSVKLDRHIVALYKRARHATGSDGNLHVVGYEVERKETGQKKICLDCLENIKELQEIETVQSICETKDVTYGGGEIANIIIGLGFGGKNIYALAGKSNCSHVGTLREVLNAICSSLGYTWYWDWTNNTVNITNSGAQIPSINLSDPSISSYSKTLSKEGTFVSASNDYAIIKNDNALLSTENYQQVILNYAGPGLDQDTICGLLSQISKDLRDDYAYGTGQLYRLGLVGTVLGGFQSVNQNVVLEAAETLGDGALYDLSKTYSVWRIAVVDPELRSYYESREAGALQSYGKKYKGPAVPNQDLKICRPGDYSKDISYDRYPNFDNEGNWEKQVGVYSPEQKSVYQGRYPAVIIPLIGALREAVYKLIPQSPTSLSGTGWRSNRSPITNTNAFTFLTQSSTNNAALSLVGWQGAPYGNYFGSLGVCAHPDEELIKDVNFGSEGYCSVDPCGQSSDPCAELTAPCSNKGKGIKQGSFSREGTCYRGIILPSTSPFYGWIKKTTNVTKIIKGKTIIKDGTLDDHDVKEARYISNDLSKNGQAKKDADYNASQIGLYALAESLSVEYIGIKEVPILGGLTSFSYIIDSNGSFTSINYSSRPDEPPEDDPVLGKVIVKKLAW